MAAVIYKCHKKEPSIKEKHHAEIWPSSREIRKVSEQAYLRSEDWNIKEVANRLLPTTSYCLHHYHCRLNCYYLLSGFLKSSHWCPQLLLFTLCSTIVNQIIMLFNLLSAINHTKNKTKKPYPRP